MKRRALRRRYGRARVHVLWHPHTHDNGAWAIVGPADDESGFFLRVHPAGDNRWWWTVEGGGRGVVGSGERELSLKSAKIAAELSAAIAQHRARRSA